MMDTKLKAELQPVGNDIQDMKNEIRNVKLFQENALLPHLETIESCYTDTYTRYRNYADRMVAMSGLRLYRNSSAINVSNQLAELHMP